MKVLVVGAGYAGTIAANRLVKKAGAAVRVTVVNPREEFVERIRLHEHLAGSGTATVPLRRMLADPVEIRVGEVTRIGDGVVNLADGSTLAFDRLVYAPGGAVVAPDGAVAVGEWESAQAGRERLSALNDGALVTVVGGGLTGIETAAEIAEARPDLRVVLQSEDEAGSSLSLGARRRVHRELTRLRVELRRGRYAGPDGADLALWAIANRVSGLAGSSGLPVDQEGRLTVDEKLRSTGDPHIYGAGDAASVPAARLSCQTALPQGAYVADTIAGELDGAQPKAYSMGYTGQNVSIGRRRGLIQVSRRDDTPTRIHVGGAPAALIKEQVCRMARGAARTGVYAWLPAPK